jgi:hypothetical protein
MKTDKEIKEITNFVKKCLKDEGYSKELIAFLFSTYDLKTFLNETVMNRLEIATHFLNHAREIHLASTNY